MFSLNDSMQYYLYRQHVDMRKGFDALCGLVFNQFHKQPEKGEVFVFLNRKRDLIKLLCWEKGGLVLYYKRLESGCIELPSWTKEAETYEIKWSDLVLMIEGISLNRVRQKKRYYR